MGSAIEKIMVSNDRDFYRVQSLSDEIVSIQHWRWKTLNVVIEINVSENHVSLADLLFLKWT